MANLEQVEGGDLSVTLIPACMQNYIYLLRWDGGAAVVDPGDARPVLDVLEAESIDVGWILATHFHADHVAGIPELKRATGAMVVGPVGGGNAKIDVGVRAGDTVSVGPVCFQVLETPGHTMRDMSYHDAGRGILFCGDTLFAGGCGRLFEGGPEDMWSSLEKLRALQDHTLVFCGHEYTVGNLEFAVSIDPGNEALLARRKEAEVLRKAGKATIPTTIGEEKKTNPFMRSDDPDLQVALGMKGAANADVLGAIRSRKDDFR